MGASAKLAEMFVEISGDLKKYYAATNKAKALTNETGESMASSFMAAGGRAASAFTNAFSGVTIVFSGKGAEAAAAFSTQFGAVPQQIAQKMAPPSNPGVWRKAGNDAAKAFADAFRNIGRMIMKKLVLFGAAAGLAALFSLHGSKGAQAFAAGFANVAKMISSPIGAVVTGGAIAALFAIAGTKAAFAFGRAFVIVNLQITKTLASIGLSIAKAFINIGKRAARAFVNAVRGAMMFAMNPMALIGGTALLGGLAYAFAKPILMASNLNETLSKVQTTFLEATKVVMAGSDEMAARFGIPKREFLDAASAIGLIGKGAKLTNTQAANLGVELAKLGVDAASFYNVPLEVALEKIRSGLVGESEPLRAFGVLLNETAVQAEALRLGLVKNKAELTEGIKVQARASLIAAGLKTATGDLERTQNSLANRLREIKGRFENLLTTIGQYFLPTAESAARVLADIGTALGGKLEAYAGIFTSWGNKLKEAAEFAGALFRNLDEAKSLGGAVLGDIGKNLQIVFGTLVDNLLKVADYMGQAIGSAIQSAMIEVAGKFAGIFGEAAGFWTKVVVAGEGVKKPERPKFEKPNIDWDASQKEFKALQDADKKAKAKTDFQAEFAAAQRELEAEIASGAEETRQRYMQQADDREAAAERQRKPIPTDRRGRLGLFADEEGRKSGPAARAPSKRETFGVDLQNALLKLKDAAEGKGPEADAGKEKLKEYEDRKKDLKEAQKKESEGAGRFTGVEEFYKQIQEGALGQNDDAKKTAEATTKMREILATILSGGLKVNTGPAVAG